MPSENIAIEGEPGEWSKTPLRKKVWHYIRRGLEEHAEAALLQQPLDGERAFLLGCLYESSLGSFRDARAMFLKAATQFHHAEAWTALGVSRIHGYGGPKCGREAVRAFHQGLLLGDPGAALQLSGLFGRAGDRLRDSAYLVVALRLRQPWQDDFRDDLIALRYSDRRARVERLARRILARVPSYSEEGPSLFEVVNPVAGGPPQVQPG